jgi:phenylacetate-CoA ligase
VTTLGRTDDMLLVRGINVFPSAVRDVIASFVPRTTGHMRIVLDTPGPLVSPPLRIEAEVGSALGAPDARDALRDQLVATIKSRLSFTADVVLVEDGAIPRTALKTQYIHKAYEAPE